MANVSVDKLTLKLSGLSHAEGERLVRQIVDGLAASELQVRSSRHIGRIEKSVAEPAATSVDGLSKLIVEELVRSLERIV